MNRRLRIAHFSPLPPAHTGIADYSAELLPALGRLADVTLFVEQPETVDESLAACFSVYPMGAYGRLRWDFDMAVYQMGNSRFHAAMTEIFRRHPGILVLHDYTLHHFVTSQTLDRDRFPAYLREMAYARGAAGLRQAREVRTGERPPPFFDIALNERLVDLSLGVIVHSDYVRRQLHHGDSAPNGITAETPIEVIPAPIAAYPAASKRSELDWPADTVIFGSFGQVTREKQIERVLRTFARLRETIPHARYLIAGEWAGTGVDLPALIAALDLGDAIYCTGHVATLTDFAGWIAAADVVVNLRAPTVGETSATALRALAAGRPLIVYDHGWYAALPDTVCLKVAPLDDTALLDAMTALARDADLRRGLGVRAREYAAETHSPARAAQAYVGFIERILADLRARHTGYAP